MGVLKVNVGTALSPDWRDIGCGGHPASSVAFLDDFNRADASTLGSPWTVYAGTWGISSNTCVRLSQTAGGVIFTTALMDAASASIDVSVKVKRSVSTDWSEIVFAYDPVTDIGYRLRFDFASGIGIARAHKNDGPAGDTPIGSITSLGATDGIFHTIRIVYDQPTANVKVYENGILKGNVTDAAGGLTGTWTGVGSSHVGASPVETFDDFTITPAVAATTGRLKLWDGTQWVREACDDDLPAAFARPLNVWTGTAWEQVACMVPMFPTLGPGPYTLHFDLRADIGSAGNTTAIVSVVTAAGTSYAGTRSATSTGISTAEWVSHTVDLSDFLVGDDTCELHLDYFSGTHTSHFRRIHVTDGAGNVVYGEYPLTFPYPGTSVIQDTAVSASAGNPEEAEEGAGSGVQWNAQTLSTDTRGDILLFIRARTGVAADHLTFGPAPVTQSFVVPAGVTSVTAEAWGAQGGDYFLPNHSGGRGGYIKATLAVTPGETLTVTPGGQGESGGFTSSDAAGGTNGGGGGKGNGGKGGGGQSDVKRGSTTLLVAAGGGGAARSSAGGDGGGSTGQAGEDGGAPATTGGGGGTTSAGGARGHECSDFPGFTQATAGSAGTGGNGGQINGGFYGGGGGGAGKFGGGGGGYGNGLVGGGGGGGGSNDTTGTVITNSQGVRSGDGLIRISW